MAVGLIALGAALVLLAPSERPGTAHQAGVAFAGFAALIGVAVIAEHLFGGFGIDELLFDDVGPDPGRPSAHTAAGLLLCGLALATLDLDQPRYRVGLVLELLAAAVAVAALIGLAYDVDYLHGRTGSAGVAVHGAIGLALVVLAIALTRPERGIVAFFRGDDPATRLIRRLTPIAILVPPLLGGAEACGRASGPVQRRGRGCAGGARGDPVRGLRDRDQRPLSAGPDLPWRDQRELVSGGHRSLRGGDHHRRPRGPDHLPQSRRPSACSATPPSR